MKKTLFEIRKTTVQTEISAVFEGGNLVFEKIDTGKKDLNWWSDPDQEYVLVLDETQVSELRNVLNLNPFARKELLETLADRFQGKNCFIELRKFLDKQRIQYRYYRWAC